MPPWIPIILALAALITSIISAILGMAGGMLLLATMLCFMSHGEAIPTHAAVQIASNGTRVLAFIKNVDGHTLGRFCLGLLPGAALGMLLLWTLGQRQQSEPYLKTLIGTFILIATYLPQGKADGRSAGTWWDFPLMGLVAGTAALTVGAVGPLIGPLFARRHFVKESLIATKAVCQLATHVLKIPAFIWLRDLDLTRLGSLALLMIVMVIPGTLIGKRILTGVPERHFRIAFRVALTVAGTKVLILDGLLNLPAWS
ncbi:MAG: sulfite exporter TauE/SafE family protein [Phycisphaerales bacterium]|nr:MAG: sulfite exporter TauE/SafE family protein [Phycisphaerales bacterium]